MTGGCGALFALDPDQAAELAAAWRDQAACKGRGALMDPAVRTDELVEAARAVCRTKCPVRTECLAWVLSVPDRNDVGGVCAGLTEDERSSMRRSATATRTAKERRPVGPPGTRWCHRCTTFKDPAEFYPDGRTADGLAYRCKACHKEIGRASQKAHAARRREKRRAQKAGRP